MGDFAILLRAGFDRWSAARMQLSTALGGVLGACFALSAQSQQGAGETPHEARRTHDDGLHTSTEASSHLKILKGVDAFLFCSFVVLHC